MLNGSLPLDLPRPEHDHGLALSPAQLSDRQAEILRLRSASPLQSILPQHDASDLALFKAADEQELPL